MVLLNPSPIPPLATLGPVHFIAIGGAGMSGVAQCFLSQGIQVSGSDHLDSPVLDQLRHQGATVWVGHDASHLNNARTVVVSTAIPPDNCELVEAKRRGIPVIHRSVALAALMEEHMVISVAGTHGKTTTTSMCVAGLLGAGQDPSFVIGGSPLGTSVSSHLGTSGQFIVEADESDGSFRQYPTSVAVVTGVEVDHVDNWETEENYIQGFLEFLTGEKVTTVVVCRDDPGASALIPAITEAGRRVLTYGAHGDSDLLLTDIDAGRGRSVVKVAGDNLQLELSVSGLHNLLNATAALCVGYLLNLDLGGVLNGLKGFTGTARRFQHLGRAGGVEIIDDYAHHPTEVTATLELARLRAGTGRVIVCFQPHLYSRTQRFAADFGRVLSKADEVVVLDVYPAREEPIEGVSGELVSSAIAIHGGHAHYVEQFDDVVDTLVGILRPGDMVITMGAGSVTTLGGQLISVLEER
ncbi:MAG: UDP-N-acetylmuramate--L-alanine ligase [Propionibacteriaceae bacterium]|nr:UDP-N-acetylmuramate--L-alanine ligase [Propionibacteriaceae bacterium]